MALRDARVHGKKITDVHLLYRRWREKCAHLIGSIKALYTVFTDDAMWYGRCHNESKNNSCKLQRRAVAKGRSGGIPGQAIQGIVNTTVLVILWV